MKLLTVELLSLFTKHGDQSDDEDPVIIAKFFTPDGGWTWYASEYNEEDQIFFGYVVGPFPEWGAFALDELQKIRGVLGLPVERDRFFEPKRFSELRLG